MLDLESSLKTEFYLQEESGRVECEWRNQGFLFSFFSAPKLIPLLCFPVQCGRASGLFAVTSALRKTQEGALENWGLLAFCECVGAGCLFFNSFILEKTQKVRAASEAGLLVLLVFCHRVSSISECTKSVVETLWNQCGLLRGTWEPRSCRAKRPSTVFCLLSFSFRNEFLKLRKQTDDKFEYSWILWEMT